MLQESILPGPDPVRHVRVEQEVHDHPAEGGEQVRHGPQVDQDHVPGHALGPGRAGHVGPPLDDAPEQVVAGDPVPLGDGLGDQGLGGGHGGPLPGLTVGRTRPWHRGARTRAAPSSASRASTRPGEALAPGGGGPGPGGEAHPAAEAAGQREHVHVTLGAEGGELVVHRLVQSGQVGDDLVAPEQVVGQGAATVEQLGRELAQQHLPIRHPFAGRGFGQGVEGADPRGREQEEVVSGPGADHEGVAVLPTGGGQRHDDVGHQRVRRQGQLGSGWGRGDASRRGRHGRRP